MMRAVVVLALVVAASVAIWLMRRDAAPDGMLVMSSEGKPARSLVVTDAEGAARTIMVVHYPRDNAIVSTDELRSLELRWGSVEGAESYLVVINNEIGEVLFRRVTTDTVLVLPAKVAGAVAPGERIKWIVQAPHVSASSDLHRVEIR